MQRTATPCTSVRFRSQPPFNTVIYKLRNSFKKNKILFENFSYLSVLQIFSTILPILTYPYLIRVLGSETYGLVIYAQAIIGYLLIFVSFGFSFSATKEISIHRNNKEKLSEIVSSVLLIKILLFILAYGILLFFLPYIPFAKGYELLFYLTMWLCFYDVIFPIWYFQGIEKMKYIAYINILSRSIFLGLIFVFIRSPQDYLLLPLINGIGALIAGLVSLYIVFVKQKITFRFQNVSTLRKYFFKSISIFISNLSVTFYSSTNKVIIGSFFGLSQVAYFDLAEKLSILIKTPIQIVGQTFFPKISKDKDLTFIKKTFFIVLALSLFIYLLSVMTADFMILILGGQEMLASVPIFQILVISIIPVTCSLFFANLTLLPFGYDKEFLNVRIYTMFFYLLIAGTMITMKLISPIMLAFALVLTETIAAIISFIYCREKKINFL